MGKNLEGNDQNDTKKSLFLLLIIFSISMSAMFYIYLMFPELDETERQYLKIPFDIEEAKSLGRVLDRYKDKYFTEVISGIMIVYVFLQTFAIPGSMFLSILSGFLFKFPVAIALVCFCSALGASLCYLLSQLVGRRLIKHFWPERAEKWSKHVDNHRDNLLSYILFLRMTPLLPNWFINLCAPVIGVPLYPFVVGTFFGVAPPSVIAIQAGKTLHNMSSSNDAFSFNSILLLTGCAALSLVPALLKKRFAEKID